MNDTHKLIESSNGMTNSVPPREQDQQGRDKLKGNRVTSSQEYSFLSLIIGCTI